MKALVNPGIQAIPTPMSVDRHPAVVEPSPCMAEPVPTMPQVEPPPTVEPVTMEPATMESAPSAPVVYVPDSQEQTADQTPPVQPAEHVLLARLKRPLLAVVEDVPQPEKPADDELKAIEAR